MSRPALTSLKRTLALEQAARQQRLQSPYSNTLLLHRTHVEPWVVRHMPGVGAGRGRGFWIPGPDSVGGERYQPNDTAWRHNGRKAPWDLGAPSQQELGGWGAAEGNASWKVSLDRMTGRSSLSSLLISMTECGLISEHTFSKKRQIWL